MKDVDIKFTMVSITENEDSSRCALAGVDVDGKVWMLEYSQYGHPSRWKLMPTIGEVYDREDEADE